MRRDFSYSKLQQVSYIREILPDRYSFTEPDMSVPRANVQLMDRMIPSKRSRSEINSAIALRNYAIMMVTQSARTQPISIREALILANCGYAMLLHSYNKASSFKSMESFSTLEQKWRGNRKSRCLIRRHNRAPCQRPNISQHVPGNQLMEMQCRYPCSYAPVLAVPNSCCARKGA